MASLAASGFAGWLLFGALTASLGFVGGRWWVPAPSESCTGPLPFPRVALASATVLIAAFGGVFLRQVLEFRDPFAPLGEDLSFLLGSGWGAAWIAGALGALVHLAGVAVAGRKKRIGWWIALIGIGIAATYPGRTGHANAVEPLRAVALVADWLHVVGAGVWLGGMGVLLLIFFRQDLDGDTLRMGLERFSKAARVSVFFLLATGGYASWLHLPELSALWTSSYGRILSAKILVACAVLALGWWNWKRGTPSLMNGGGLKPMRRSVGFEFALAQIVLILTAFLVRASPTGPY